MKCACGLVNSELKCVCGVVWRQCIYSCVCICARVAVQVRLCEVEDDPQGYHEIAEDEDVLTITPGKNQVLGEVLMYVMEVREELEHESMSPHDLESALLENSGRVSVEIDHLTSAFACMTKPDLDTARQALMHLSYYKNLEHEIKNQMPVI